MPMTIPFYMENTAGDEYTMEIRNTSGNNAAIIVGGIFIIMYLHE